MLASSCAMNTYKTICRVCRRGRCWRGDVGWRPGRRCGAAAVRVAGPAESALRQAGLPLRGRRAARPLCIFAPKTAGRGRLRYVPAALVEVVRRCVDIGAEVEAVLAEISAINTELLVRRELG